LKIGGGNKLMSSGGGSEMTLKGLDKSKASNPVTVSKYGGGKD
jgi:hypothetical protein